MTAVLPAAGWGGAFLGLAASLVLAWYGFRAQRRPGSVRIGQLRLASFVMLGGAVLSMAALETALLTDDFAMSYVAETHSRATPLLFTITSAWSALGGSIVLWTLLLAGYVFVARRKVTDPGDRLGTGALGVMGLVAAFFFGLVTTVANPFRIVANPPADGPGPNPLLRNDIMVAIHPPLLYLGFVGFTVSFAYAMSALLIRRGGTDWLVRTRRANLVAWTFLTAGLIVGAWWSYQVLGWGGYWAWDPVENAALIPWLAATAFVHSAVVQVKRGTLQAWNFVLALATFALTILGTFLTRSSVVASVHSFTQSGVGPALLGFFVVVLAGGFTLFALRGEHVASRTGSLRLASREGLFLVNNLVLCLFAFVVLLGTVYPIFVEAFTGGQVSVGRPFFDRMAVPLSFALLLAMGAGPFTPYRWATARVLWTRLAFPMLIGSIAAAAFAVAGIRSVGVVAVAFLAATIVSASIRHLFATAPNRRPSGLWRLVSGQRAYWGGQLAHIGVAVVALAISVAGATATRATVTLTPEHPAEFAGYTVMFTKSEQHTEPDRTQRDAHLEFRDNGQLAWTAQPKLETFANQPQAVGTPDVWSTAGRDVYVALAQIAPGTVTVNLYRYPLMSWLWTGGFLMAAGGAWALSERRRRGSPTAEPAEETVSHA
ncbi:MULTISPECIES: heme lyase CcmF/NrfE family subunit [Amycolatopsis]|uniref:Cytochrome c-type biogenesis protein CcmF n=1 Tax=Amycolatopsis echigonensis TaxID=2576905 RepID=A0A2N3WLA6_9PSEU|nr:MULTISPECIES: heme lyase CcmF/NrfE family subunit [Amycolatopsis]MBB2500842.1 heme lyase CcmF/NrfE family subunit [Amycolatopsis echigonensis]MCG3751201.1 heme lyase CcmF/NrfE family subunit [Amycolatopsis sp. Poz14]PKV94664.1 cytochrome c-type biogenesis protein CcmF [Amycolatopsis niigatensis]